MNQHSHRLFVSSIRASLGFVSLFGITLLVCLLASATIVEAREPTWSATGSLGTARSGPTATLLANGQVLVVGGFISRCNPGCSTTGSAELYDPATGTWSYTGNLNAARGQHSATLLPDGKILVAGGTRKISLAGGVSNGEDVLNSAELYDPATATWSSAGNLNTARVGHTATLLPNGKVLVAGGDSNGNSAELYDPGTGIWSSTGNLNNAHGGTATLLRNGKVLVLGGASIDVSNSAELYDPATETWSVTGNLNTGRWYAHTATLLPNGEVLVAAGSIGGDDVLESAELYDPVTGTWTDTGDLNIDRGVHTATLLPSGKVLVAGGFDYDYESLDSAELYDPATGSWSVSGSLNTSRSGHTATLLANGKVLVAAGDSGGSTTTSAELFDSGASSNYQGLWWNSPPGSESGWGINFAHQGDIIFASWFTYDLTGKGLWLVMTAPKTAPGVYSGTLYTTTGPAFNAVPFNPAQVVATQAGSGTLTFSDANNGTFAYTVNGISQTKAITREVFGPLPTCTFGAQPNLALATNYQDLWWAAPAGSESGWGVNFTHQGDTIVATWFTYDLDRTPMWLVVTTQKTAPGTYSGTLYRTTGPAFNAVPFNPANVVATAVGTVTLTFSDGTTGTFAYTLNGVSQTKAIAREVFTNPGTICQ